MEESEKRVITPAETEKKLWKLPYTKEEMLDWERWGNENFGHNERN